MSADVLGPVRVAGPKGERYGIVFTYQYPKQHLAPEDLPVPEEELDGWNLDAKDPSQKQEEFSEDMKDYEPDEDEAPELTAEELRELQRVRGEVPEMEEISELFEIRKFRKKPGLNKEPKEDWWEFREATGVLVRHHEAPRTSLFRPTSWNGCPVHPAKLEPTRVTQISYVGGGVEMETSDWQGPQSGSRKLSRSWTGRSTFRISPAEEPEDEELLKKDEEYWEKIIGDLTQPVEMDTIYMVYPVRARRGGDALLAIQEAVLRLKLWGLPVARLHTDRGSEFASKGLRRWLLDRDIFHTRSESLVPQTNGAAERGVRWFKTRAKVLLAEAKVNTKYWTLAMQHAANRRIYDRLGLTKPALLPFGSTVMIRRKVFGNNKKYDLTDRWEQGKYLGLSDSTKGGAVVLRPSGILTETLNLRTDVVDPRRLLQEEETGSVAGGIGELAFEEPVIDLPEPDHRLKGKQAPPEMRKVGEVSQEPTARKPTGWTMRRILKVQEEKAKQLYDMGKFNAEDCAALLEDLDLTGKMRTRTRGQQTSSMILGAYVHGGMRGITTASRKRPWLTKYLNMVLRMRTAESLEEECHWTTLGIFRAAEIPPHRDLRKQPNTRNYVTEIGSQEGGGLWVERTDGEVGFVSRERGTPYQRELPDGTTMDGDIVRTTSTAVSFDPKKVHSYMNRETERWVLAGFTPLGVDKLKAETVQHLLHGGFPLEGSDVPLGELTQLSDEWEGSDVDSEIASSSEEDEEVEEKEQQNGKTNGFQTYVEKMYEDYSNDMLHKQEAMLRKILKVNLGESREVEVEALLEALQEPLEMVHNVSLPEMKKYLSRWKPAIAKEVSGTVRKIGPEEARRLKAEGLMVLPGKGVFTAKPPTDKMDTKAGYFRRKCRIVACGNYIPQDGMAVYASGTTADSFRFAVAYAIYRRWTAGGTDVSNAFTLAPMPGDKLYALQPPAVVVMAQEALQGELWLIERVLYGLREAPRLWGGFRDGRFREAKIQHEDRVLTQQCLETDENVWLIKYQGEPEVQGVMLVYVDDILFLSTCAIVQSMYAWLVSEWKCTSLEMLNDGFIRFLGMELRNYQDGIHISQAGYVRDLLRQGGVQEQSKGLTVPCAREWLQDDDSDDEREVADPALIKIAQKATGELLWLSTRSRPELAHSVACMAAKALNKPRRSIEIHKRVMQYLSRTADYGMYYFHDPEEPLLAVYSDASFAPGGGRSFGCIMAQLGGMTIAWRASKQPIISLSVAEAELYEGVSAVQLGLEIEALLKELQEEPVMVLRIDNQAAQGLASESPGSWKTRHLRVRARFLRQETLAKRLLIIHVPGGKQRADLGTKAFDLPRFRVLLGLWNMVPWVETANTAVKTVSTLTSKKALLFVMICLMLVKGVQGHKEALPLDGSVEFYFIVVVLVIAAATTGRTTPDPHRERGAGGAEAPRDRAYLSIAYETGYHETIYFFDNESSAEDTFEELIC
ncbi:RE1 [Symbiodinium sp. CCMP2456]|nr:RE1 [Symbiodinium sp. CCMP2456]